MELRELIKKTHELSEQLKQLEASESGIKQEIQDLEKQIKLKLDENGQDYENLSEEEFQLMMAELGDPMQLTVQVVYATNENQFIKEVQLPRNATIEDGIKLSGLLELHDEIDLQVNKIGIFGAIKPISQKVINGDRIEIYRPVTAKDPKSA